METKLARRWPGSVPFGYAPVPDDPKHMITIPAQLVLLDQAFSYLDKGFSIRDVAVWLQDKSGRRISHVALYRRHRRLKRKLTDPRKTRIADFEAGIATAPLP